jgi:hypothetical protein
VYVLLPVSDSGSRCHLPSLERQYGGFDARTRFLLHPSHATWSEVFFIVIGALRPSTMTFARGSSLADTELPSVWSATLSATCEAAENDCLERRNSIRPCVPSHVAYKAERGGNEPFWSPWTMYPRSQERRRNREATVHLPALGGAGLGLIVRSEYTNARKRRQPNRA